VLVLFTDLESIAAFLSCSYFFCFLIYLSSLFLFLSLSFVSYFTPVELVALVDFADLDNPMVLS
jgi:hypothetical protein